MHIATLQDQMQGSVADVSGVRKPVLAPERPGSCTFVNACLTSCSASKLCYRMHLLLLAGADARVLRRELTAGGLH
jgi:hypothetical protein